ncbi:MAG: hypothetical protein M3153_12490 [Chloroflexota bacterium]|nr:hypothetical protein [Chloroflexota bacterium]
MTIGAIDPNQRHVAERLVLLALRRFHREQPLSVDMRMDALVARVTELAERRPPSRHRGGAKLDLPEADLRRVIDDLVTAGKLVRDGRRIRLADAQTGLDPDMADKVSTLLAGLRAAGAAPPRVEGIAGRLGIPPTVIDQLRSAGQLRQIAPGIDYPADVWSALRARIEGMAGTVTIARLRDELRASRRHAEAILAAVGQRNRPGGTRPRPRPRTQRDRRAVR